MAKKNVSNLFHADFVAALTSALDKRLGADSTSCVSSLELTKDPRVLKVVKSMNLPEAILKVLVMAAVRAGQLEGFTIRKGRDGGIMRIGTSKPAVKPKAKPSSKGEKPQKPASSGKKRANNPVQEAVIEATSEAPVVTSEVVKASDAADTVAA